MTIFDDDDAVSKGVNLFPTSLISEEEAGRKGILATLAQAEIEGTEDVIPPQQYAESIMKAGGDAAIRDGFVRKAQASEIASVLKVGTESDLRGSRIASELLLDRIRKFEDDGEYKPSMDIIEYNAAGELINSGIATDEVRGQLLELSTDNASFLDQYQNSLALILMQDEIAEEFQAKVTEQGFLSTAGDAAAYLIPFYTAIARGASSPEGEEVIITSVGLRENYNAYRNLSYKEKVVFLKKTKEDLSKGLGIFSNNALAAATEFEQLTDLNTAEAILEDMFNVLDLTYIGGSLGRFIKSLVSGAKLGRNASMTLKATDDVLARLERGEPVALDEADDALATILPTALNASAIKSEPLMGKSLNKILENQAILDEATSASKGFRLDRLTPEEAKQVDEASINRIKRELKLNGIKAADVNVLEDSQIRRISVLFGHGIDNTTGYVSEAAAIKGAGRKGIVGDQFSVEKIQGKFFIKVERDGAERGVINSLDEELTANTWYSNIPYVRYTAGAKSLLSFDLAAQSEVAARAFQKNLTALTKVLETINALPKKKLHDLLAITTYNQQTETWFSVAELQSKYQSFFKREATSPEIEAYFAHRQLSDYQWSVRNNEFFTASARDGYQETVIDTLGIRTNGKEVTSLANPLAHPVAVVSREGVIEVFERGSLSTTKMTEVDTLLGADKIVIKLQTPTVLQDGVKVEFVITSKAQASFGPLRAQQLSYVPGGSRIYKGKNFVKQIRITKGADGVSYRTNDRTHFPMQSRAEALKVADEHNLALEAFLKAEKSGKAEDIALATKTIQLNTRYEGFTAFKKLVDEGQIERSPFEVVGDRGVIPHKGNPVQALDNDFENYSDDIKDMLSRGALWYSKRGDALPHPQEGLAPILDPFEAMSLGVTNASKTAAYNTLKIRGIESWISKYGQYLVLDDNIASPIQRFMNSSFKSGNSLSPKELGKAEVVRQTLKRMLHTPTVDQLAAEQLKDRLVDFLDAKGMRKLSASIGDTDFRPLELMREISFKARLGMGDISQMVVQMSMTPGVVAAGGLDGLKALGLLPWIKMAHRSPAIINKIAPLVKLTSGMDAKTFKVMMEDIRKSGVGLIGNTQAQLDTYSKVGVSRLPVLHTIKKFTDHLSYFFESAERANQYLGFSIAWIQNGSKALVTSQDIARVALKSEAFAGNMRSSSNAWWQKGVLSLATQFQGHPARVTEIMLGALGAGTSGGLGRLESLRYMSALALVYGAAAIPLAEYTYSKLTEGSGDGLVSKEQHILITRGILGALLPEISFKRIQPFGNDNLVQEFFKGEKSVLQLMTGPAGDLINDAAQPIVGALMLAQLFYAEEGAVVRLDPTLGDVSLVLAEFVKEIGKNISSVNRGLKSYYAFQLGKYFTKHGEVIQNVSAFQAGMLAIGFPPANSATAFEAQYSLKQRQDNLREVAKGMAKIMREALRATDDKVRKDKWRLLYINMAIIDSEADRREIQKMTMNQMKNMRNITEDQFRAVYKVFGFAEADRRFNYRGAE